MSPSRTGSLPALPNKPFQAPRRSRASTTSSSSKSPVVRDDALQTALQRLKERNNIQLAVSPPPRKSADPLYALWAGVLPQIGGASSLNSTTLVRATEAIPIEALEGGNELTEEAIDAVVDGVERVMRGAREGGGADADDAQDWKDIVAWLQRLADLAARQRRNGVTIETVDENRLLVGNLYHVADHAGINAGSILAGPASDRGMGVEDDFDFGSLLLDGLDDEFLKQLEGGGITQDQKRPPPRRDGAPSPHHDSVDLRKMKSGSQSSSLAAAAAAAGASGTLANGIGGPPSTLGVANIPSQGRVAQNNDDDYEDADADGGDEEAATSRAVNKAKRARLRLRRDRTGSIDEQMREEDLAAETDNLQKQAQLGREAGSRVPVQPPSRPASSARPPTVVRQKAREPVSKKSQQGLFERPNFDQQDGNDDEEEVDMLDDEEGELPVAGPSKPKGKTGRRKKAVVAPPPPREEAEEEEDQLASSDPGVAPPPPAQLRKARKAPRVDTASKSGGKATKNKKVGGKRASARRDYTSSEEEEKAGSASVRKGKRKAVSSAGSASEDEDDSLRARAAKARGSRLAPPPKRRSTRSASVSTVNSAGTAASSRKALKPKDANVKPNRSKSKEAAGGKKLAAADVALREKEGKDKKGKVKPSERERTEGTRKSSRPSIGRNGGAKGNGIKEAADAGLKAGEIGYKQHQTDGSRCWPVLVLKVEKSRIAFASLPGPNTAADRPVPPIASKADEVPLLPPPRQIALKAAMGFLADSDRYDEWRGQAEEAWERVAAEYGMDVDAKGGDDEEDERRSSASGSEDSE